MRDKKRQKRARRTFFAALFFCRFASTGPVDVKRPFYIYPLQTDAFKSRPAFLVSTVSLLFERARSRLSARARLREGIDFRFNRRFR